MKKNILLLVIVGIIGLGAAAGQAATWDLNADWEAAMPTSASPGVNPNGQWSYGYNTTLTKASFALNTAWQDWSGALAVWASAINTWPLMWHSYTLTDTAPSGAEPGEFVMQSGYNHAGVNSVVRWTAPAAGIYEIMIDWQYGYGVEGTTILLNDSVLSTAPVGDHAFYFQTSTLSAGDTIDFVMLGQTGTSNGSVLYFNVAESVEPTEPTESVECILWLDAASGLADPNTGTPYVDGDVVKRWQDTQSGNAMKANLAWGAPTLETGEINGQNVIRFTGDDGLVIDPNSDPDDLLNAPNFTIYVVGRINDLALSQIFYANYSDPAAGAAVGISDSQFNTVKYYTKFGGTLSPADELVEGRYYLMAVTRSWLGERNLYINGELAATGSGKATYNTDTVASIGALDIGRQFLTGDIAEIRVYDGVDADLQNTVTSDLMSKYNIDTTPVVSDPNVISLTGITLTRCNSLGTMNTAERYNTLFFDGAWDMALYEGDLITNPALYDPNHPGNFWLNDLSHMMIDIPLRLGEVHTFNWHNARPTIHTEIEYMGVNLFFEGSVNDKTPGISVYALMDSTGPDDDPPDFLPNHASSTMGWPITSIPGSGSEIYYDLDKKMKVTMTDFVVYHPDVYDLDFVGAQFQDPNDGIHPVLGGNDGEPDMIGRFTLKVETLDCSTLDHFAADFDKNCRVDLDDFAQLIAAWLQCNDPRNPEDCTNP